MILPPDRPLLDLQGRALVVPVNRVGVMGAGATPVYRPGGAGVVRQRKAA